MRRLYRYIVGAVWIVLLGGAMVAGCSKATEPQDTEPENSAPTINSFYASPQSIVWPFKDSVVFNFSVTDPDNDPVTCEIDATGDAIADTMIANCSVGSYTHYYTQNDGGIKNVTLKAIDSQNNMSDSSIQVSVVIAQTQSSIVRLGPDSIKGTLIGLSNGDSAYIIVDGTQYQNVIDSVWIAFVDTVSDVIYWILQDGGKMKVEKRFYAQHDESRGVYFLAIANLTSVEKYFNVLIAKYNFSALNKAAESSGKIMKRNKFGKALDIRKFLIQR